MIKRIFSLLSLLLIICNIAGAQTFKKFTEDATKFPLEMQAFLEETNKKESEETMKQFNLLWLSKRFAADQQEGIYRTANTMLKKRMKAFPDFKNYIDALVSFGKSKQSDESFEAWQLSLDQLLEKSNKYFSSYINTCNILFTENALYASTTTKWTVNTENYTFGVDSLPKIIFADVDITCHAKGDSATIYKTKGAFYPLKNRWFGTGGKVNWTRAGISEDSVFAILKKYMIEMNGSDYVADSVIFTNKVFFQKPLIGRLNDKLLANTKEETATYPRFDSYNTNIDLKNIYKDVDYHGGFSMNGSKFIGAGGKNADATLTFYRNKKRVMLSASKGFVMKVDKITSQNASLKVFYGNDSIFHPNLELKLLKEKNELTVTRTETGLSKSPFFDSYHKMEMKFDQITWQIGDSIANMKMISAGGTTIADFESENFYKDSRFDKIQGIEDQNPLQKIKRFADKNNSKQFYVEDYAKYIRLPIEEVKGSLISLSAQGFLVYDLDNEQVTVKDKLNFYLKSKFKQCDYDVIRFESAVNGNNNARLNLNTFDLNISGVNQIFMSDSQNVAIVPKNRQIVLKNDRNLVFSGIVFAGRFEFYGKNFDFDYEKFKINLNNVDSLRFQVELKDQIDTLTGKPKLILVKSVVEHINGDLLIDAPTNKSARTNIAAFPIFNSKKDSYVYYDKSNIFNKVYNRDKFFFHLDPFTVDSLDNFTAAGLKFSGELESANIFPIFKDTLVLRPDYSLGFIHNTPEAGLEVYKGKGNYKAVIDLSNRGLRGSGSLDYLASTAKSNEFFFFPDSTNAIAQDYEIRKESIYPSTVVKDVNIHWMPYNDLMSIRNRTVPFAMYDAQTQLQGGLLLAPKGLTGDGVIALKEAKLEAKLYSFKQTTFSSDSASINMKSDISTALAFSTNNVKAFINMETLIGDFKSNNPDDYVKFPLNQYICYIDQFKWFMEKREIELGGGGTSINPKGYEYVSIHPQQDSLTFYAPVARFSIKDYKISAKKVSDIVVADATIFPDSGNVVIEVDAHINTLKNSKVTANNDTKYHNLYNAAIDIQGRKSYTGSSDYDITNKQKMKQKIHFSQIRVDSLQTTAMGEIGGAEDFSFSPQISYKGAVKLKAKERDLTYAGYGRLKTACFTGKDSVWFKFNSIIDPDSIFIPIDDFMDEKGNMLAAAFGMNDEGKDPPVSTMFLTNKNGETKDQFMSAKGYLTYDKPSGEYRISSKARLTDTVSTENYMSLKDKNCVVYGEGDLNLSNDYGRVDAKTIGKVTSNLNSGEIVVNTYMALDFYFPSAALDKMNEEIAITDGVGPVDPENPVVDYSLTKLIGKAKTEEYENVIALYGKADKMPKELEHTLTISNVKLVWDNFNKAFRSEGPIGVAAVGKQQVNKQMKGKIEIIKRGRGDVITIFIQPDEFSWYYFSYDDNVMQSVSSNQDYNDALKDIDPKKQKLKAEKGKPAYEYTDVLPKKKEEFLRRVGKP